MPTVEYIKEEKITSGLVKIINEHYEIPEKIDCTVCSGFMPFSSYHRAYMCLDRSCRGYKSANDYIESKLKEAETQPEPLENNI